MKYQILIAKYLGIIKDQSELVKELSESRKALLSNNADLKRQNQFYKQNILHWKNEHDKLQECLIDMKVKCVNVYEANALNAYKKMSKV